MPLLPGMAEGEALRIGATIAAGLASLHAAKILHRDVKPENVSLLAMTIESLVESPIARAHMCKQLRT